MEKWRVSRKERGVFPPDFLLPGTGTRRKPRVPGELTHSSPPFLVLPRYRSNERRSPQRWEVFPPFTLFCDRSERGIPLDKLLPSSFGALKKNDPKEEEFLQRRGFPLLLFLRMGVR